MSRHLGTYLDCDTDGVPELTPDGIGRACARCIWDRGLHRLQFGAMEHIDLVAMEALDQALDELPHIFGDDIRRQPETLLPTLQSCVDAFFQEMRVLHERHASGRA